MDAVRVVQYELDPRGFTDSCVLNVGLTQKSCLQITNTYRQISDLVDLCFANHAQKPRVFSRSIACEPGR